MKTAVREQRIISILESRGEMSVNELGAILNISVSTLRKQLADMQEKKLIIRTYGGVMSINPVPDETFDSKLHKNVNEKRRIATKARSLIKSGDSLSLGSGTTVYALSNLLDDLSSAEIYTKLHAGRRVSCQLGDTQHPHLRRHNTKRNGYHHRQRGVQLL